MIDEAVDVANAGTDGVAAGHDGDVPLVEKAG